VQVVVAEIDVGALRGHSSKGSLRISSSRKPVLLDRNVIRGHLCRKPGRPRDGVRRVGLARVSLSEVDPWTNINMMRSSADKERAFAPCTGAYAVGHPRDAIGAIGLPLGRDSHAFRG